MFSLIIFLSYWNILYVRIFFFFFLSSPFCLVLFIFCMLARASVCVFVFSLIFFMSLSNTYFLKFSFLFPVHTLTIFSICHQRSIVCFFNFIFILHFYDFFVLLTMFTDFEEFFTDLLNVHYFFV